jgi:hypothetical protein
LILNELRKDNDLTGSVRGVWNISVEHKKKWINMQKKLSFLAILLYNSAMEKNSTTAATTARLSTSDDAEFEARFGSESDVQDWLGWRADCLEADMSEPFLDDAH